MLNGEELKRVRMLRGISQSQLANTLGFTNRYIIQVECGDREASQDTYDRWITALYDDETKEASKKKVITTGDAKKAKANKKKKETK